MGCRFKSCHAIAIAVNIMTSQEIEAKAIALMKKLGVWDDEDKLQEWLHDYVVVTDTCTGELTALKRSEFQPDMVGLTCVLCGVYDPFMPMRPGAWVQPCHDCRVPIVVSPDSPADPPKVCRDCALVRFNNEKETNP